MKHSSETTASAFKHLCEITETLISDKGCPWDKDQTPLSLRRDLIEEAFEVSDAVTQKDVLHVKEELGDVLFNVALMASVFEKSGDFSFADVIDMISEKLIRRHPHVFKESEGVSELKENVKDSVSVLNQWDRIKENVEGRKGKSILDSVPQDFPPLLKAYKYVSKAAKKGFTWSNPEAALKKVMEEIAEVQEAATNVKEVKVSDKEIPFTKSSSNEKLNENQLALEEEIGDAFLALANYSRMLCVDPSIALDRANRKFSKRFRSVEEGIDLAQKNGNELSLNEMCALWNQAKACR